jgi:general nucleoside transport system permease protein
VSVHSLHFERRLETPRWLPPALPLFAVLVSLVVGGLVLLLSGHDPIASYDDMFTAAFTAPGALSATLVSATPLLLTGLAAATAFRMRAWNIGGDGQLYIGAIFASAAGLLVGDHGLGLALPAMILAGMLGGGLWAAIPGVLRAFLSTNEVLVSLMLNYVGALVMYYLIFDSRSYWRDVTSPGAQTFPQGKSISASSFWPTFGLGGLVVPLGLVLGIVLAVCLYLILRSTKFGFQMRVVADSPAAGRYAGIRTRGTFVAVMLISGALAGLAGASQVGDFSHTLEPRPLEAAAFGYAGIVAAALARCNPLGVIAAAVFLGGLTNAGYSLQGPDLPAGLVGVITGIMLFSVASSELLARYRLNWRSGHPSQAPAPPSALPEPATARDAMLADKSAGGSA